MNVLFGLLPAAACIGGMYVCMRMMGHLGRKTDMNDTSHTESPEEVAALRDEVRRLRSLVESHEGPTTR